jgi:hypothetical protein
MSTISTFSKPAFEKLHQDELVNFDNYEYEIQSGLKDFIKVGNALAAIHDQRLYREKYPTFEAYCQTRWGFSQWYAYKLQKSADVVKRLDNCPMPTSEAQVRPLTTLPDEEQAEAWQEAVETAPDGKVTADHVASVVKKRKKAERPEDARTRSRNFPDPQAPLPGEPKPIFATLPSLPNDVSDAFEAYKLCILRHKLGGWVEFSKTDMVTSLTKLIELAEHQGAV